MSTFYMSSLYANIVQSIRTIIDNAANTTELQSASNGTNFQIEACGLRIANCCAEIHIEKNGANGDYNGMGLLTNLVEHCTKFALVWNSEI